MHRDRLPVFCDTALAERIERTEAELTAMASEAANRRRTDMSGFVIPIVGGVATFAAEGSPFNKIAGLEGRLRRAGLLEVVTRPRRNSSRSGSGAVAARRPLP